MVTLPPPRSGPARAERRHDALAGAFAVLVLGPLVALGLYLFRIAEDQYASLSGFTVRAQDASEGALAGSLAGFAELTGGASGAEDTEILYDYLQSQALVETLRGEGAFDGMWRGSDPVFALDPGGTIEDLRDHWALMTGLAHDSRTRIVHLEVRAFDPRRARRLAEAALAAGTRLVNEISAAAREEATSHARAELARAEARLSEARAALTAFRTDNRMIDPSADVAGQMGLLATLETQLAEALIAEGLLVGTTGGDDPRLVRAARRIEVIRERIAEERRAIGEGAAEGGDFARLTADYERLSVEREFAEMSYTAARARLDAAEAEARRTSRYLAVHVAPTEAEIAEHPRRWIILGLAALALTGAWALLVLVYYSVRDRRPA